MRILFTILSITILAASVSAADKLNSVGLANANHTIKVEINGLVCDFCARALEKVFGRREEVTGVDVNLDTKLVTIGLQKNTDIDDATITKLINDAGYNVIKINR